MKERIITITVLVLIIVVLAVGASNNGNAADEQDKKAIAEAKELDKKANELFDAGNYDEALPLAQKSLEIKEKELGKGHPEVAVSLNSLAMIYHATGKYGDAELLYKRALDIREKTADNKHPEDVAESLNNLAALYRAKARYSEAEPLYKRALEIDERKFGKENPTVATNLNNLAALYRVTGRYSEAEPLYKRALEIDEKALGKEHPDVATDMNNLAVLYRDTGRYELAEPLHKRVIEIDEKAFGKEHPGVATDLHNLAVLYNDTGRYALAEPLFKRALNIFETQLGKEHPRVAQCMNNLVKLYHATGKDKEAEPLAKQALNIDEKAFGTEHPNVAVSLNNLAVLYRDTGRYALAESLFTKALDIREKAFGKKNPRVTESLNNLARLYASTNKHGRSHDMYVQGMNIEDLTREDVFSLLSEKQKLTYMEQKQQALYEFINHTNNYMKEHTEAVSDTLNTWLRWKGAVMEAQGRYIDAVTYSKNPKVRQQFDELRKCRMQLAKLQMAKPEKVSFEEYKQLLIELQNKKDSLEAELSQLSKEFASDKKAGKADIATISAILPQESAYIDYVKIDVYDFQKQKWGKTHYLAFLMIAKPGAKPFVKLFDIAGAEALDTHIQVYLKEMKKVALSGKTGKEILIKKEAMILYRLLLKPIEAFMELKTKLYISPDGNLHLIPFEVLMTENKKYLMEKYQINYISAGRDIVRFDDSTIAEGEVILMGDPDYDLSQDEKAEKEQVAELSSIASSTKFLRLPETKLEVDAIEKIIKEKYNLPVKNFQGKQAREEVLFNLESPRILHLATHGYFLKDEEVTEQNENKQSTIDSGIENPMTRSAIVLAGANTSLREGRDEGIVSAEKVLSLKLKGADLVVLSACETGLGDIKNGEGVFGLKRAFILAGAKTVVMSLWSVPSTETMNLMTNFYELMSKGKSKTESLRIAKLTMLKKKPHPFFWAAFVMTGNPD